MGGACSKIFAIERRGATFSRFDIVAACGTSFLKNMTMTIVLPVLLSSAEARSESDPLLSSGLVAASFSLGMVLSTSLMCCWNEVLLDSRLPFVMCGALLLAGNLAYMAAELLIWPTLALVIIRFIMALGFGAQFAGKRRGSMETNKKRREYIFMLIEAANSVGQAAGPILMGVAASLGNVRWTIVYPGDSDSMRRESLANEPQDAFVSSPFGTTTLLATSSSDSSNSGFEKFMIVLAPIVTIVLSIAFLLTMFFMPIDTPFFKETAASTAPSPSDPKAKGTKAVAVTAQQEDPPAPLWVSYVVQSSCLFYGVSRNFLFFGYESAAVVVYNRELLMPTQTASLIVGCCALTPLFALVLYSRYSKELEGRSQELLLTSEMLGISASVLFMCSAYFEFEETSLLDAADPSEEARSRLDAVRVPFMIMMTIASVCFYASIYLGAAMGNSHPLQYAIEGHPLLSKQAMVAEQQILQSTLGKGLGMIVCRVVLGNPVKLENLGRLFLFTMLSQVVILTVGWDPLKTQRRIQALFGKKAAISDATKSS